MDNLQLFLAVLGLCTTVAFGAWGIIVYLQDKINKGDEKLWNEISKFRDNHVHKDDFHIHTQQVDRRFNMMQDALTTMGNTLTHRLDSVILLLSNINSGSKD